MPVMIKTNQKPKLQKTNIEKEFFGYFVHDKP